MRILVTGSGGFVGRHLIRHLLECGDQVIAAYHPREIVLPDAGLRNYSFDILDVNALEEVVAGEKVEAVIHLAALAFVPDADKDPGQTMAVNVGGTANLLQSLAVYQPQARILLVSSSEVYDASQRERMPLGEHSPIRPNNYYALSKWLAENLALWAIKERGMDIVIARPFNHIGPGQSPRFAVSGFARQLAAIAAGRVAPILEVGDLEVQRDMSDVRDIVQAYRLALEKIPVGTVFNICSGQPYKIGWLLEQLISLAQCDVEVRVDPRRLRKRDVPFLSGSCKLFKDHTGWATQVSIFKTLYDTLDYWRQIEDEQS